MSAPSNISVDFPDSLRIEKKQIQKMVFIINALEKGWAIKKINDSYIFTKKHEGKREVFQENYLETFVRTNSTDLSILDKI
jgi:hypothetical protein